MIACWQERDPVGQDFFGGIMFGFDVIKTALGNCRFPDDQILKRVGLEKLAKSWDAYPQSLSGIKICILLPKGMTLQDAVKLDEASAVARGVIVLRENGSAWQKAWPLAASKPASAAQPAPKQSVPPRIDVPKAAPVEMSNIEIVEEED